MTVALGAACLLLAGLIVPAAVTTAQAGPSVQPRSGSAPTTTLAVIRLISVGMSPRGVAVDQGDDTVYVANQSTSDVSIINGRSATIAGTIAVVSGPNGVAVNQGDDTVYVANEDTNTVSVINGRTATMAGTINVGLNPRAVAVNQGDDTVYVANNGGNTVSVIDGRLATVASTIAVGLSPNGVAVNQGDDTVYVANNLGNTVSVINERTLDDSSTIGVGGDPIGVAVDQDDDTVYVTNFASNDVSVINGRTGNVATLTGVGSPWGLAVDQNDDTVYVANEGTNSVTVINGRTATVDDTITVGRNPYGIAVDDTGANSGLVYVTNYFSDNMSVIGRVTPSLGSASGYAGDAVTINVNVPQVDYEVDPETVESVSFGGITLSPTAQVGDAWQVTAPVGTPGSSVAVTVTFRGGLTASAGTFTYNVPPVFPPGATTGVTAVARDAQATVTWSAPASSGSFPVTRYEVRSTPAGGTCLVATLTCTITGLTNGMAYTFEVRALNGAGWGPWSTPSNAVTPAAPPPPPLITITGSRGTGAERQVVFVTGTSTGLDGQQVRAHVKLRGQASYRPGRLVDLASDGTFGWQRTTGKKAYVYFTGSGVQSNRVIIPAARK